MVEDEVATARVALAELERDGHRRRVDRFEEHPVAEVGGLLVVDGHLAGGEVLLGGVGAHEVHVVAVERAEQMRMATNPNAPGHSSRVSAKSTTSPTMAPATPSATLQLLRPVANRRNRTADSTSR